MNTLPKAGVLPAPPTESDHPPQTDSLFLSDEEDTGSEPEQVTKHGERSSMYNCFSNNLGCDLSSKLKLKIVSLEFINFIDLLDSEEREEAHQSSDLKGINARFSSPSSRKDNMTIDQWLDAYMVYA